MTTKITADNIAQGEIQEALENETSTRAFFYNSAFVSENVIVSSNVNAGSFGPVEILEGYEVELQANATWTIV